MVDIDGALKVEIEVKNYEQVVKNDKGRSLALRPRFQVSTPLSKAR